MPTNLSQPPHPRRWFQFRLRTLLIAVALLCVIHGLELTFGPWFAYLLLLFLVADYSLSKLADAEKPLLLEFSCASYILYASVWSLPLLPFASKSFNSLLLAPVGFQLVVFVVLTLVTYATLALLYGGSPAQARSRFVVVLIAQFASVVVALIPMYALFRLRIGPP